MGGRGPARSDQKGATDVRDAGSGETPPFHLRDEDRSQSTLLMAEGRDRICEKMQPCELTEVEEFKIVQLKSQTNCLQNRLNANHLPAHPARATLLTRTKPWWTGECGAF